MERRGNPKLRWPLDLRVERTPEQQVIVLRCPLGVAPRPLALKIAAGPLLNCLNGEFSAAEIVARFSSQGLNAAALDQLLGVLDEHLFLESPRYEAAFEAFKRDFAALPVRPLALRGAGYPADREELTRMLDTWIKQGRRDGLNERPLAALIAPHIDYRRGGSCYGAAYAALEGRRFDLIVLIGIAHQYSPLMFHMTLKDLATPFGIIACDRQLAERIVTRYGRPVSYTHLTLPTIYSV